MWLSPNVRLRLRSVLGEGNPDLHFEQHAAVGWPLQKAECTSLEQKGSAVRCKSIVEAMRNQSLAEA